MFKRERERESKILNKRTNKRKEKQRQMVRSRVNKEEMKRWSTTKMKENRERVRVERNSPFAVSNELCKGIRKLGLIFKDIIIKLCYLPGFANGLVIIY